MVLFRGFYVPKSFSPLSVVNSCPSLVFNSYPNLPLFGNHNHVVQSFTCLAVSRDSDSKPRLDDRAKPKPKSRVKREVCGSEYDDDECEDEGFPRTIPRKPRRGRRSEAVAVEDFVRGKLEQTFASIREKNADVLEGKESVFKDRVEGNVDSDEDEDEGDDKSDGDVKEGRKKKMVVEDDDPSWPVDADVGWGIRASEYFEQHPIKNVVGDDGFEIDWEGEMDGDWVKEINCLDWESFAYHPSPLVVLVFERYNRATENWKTLKELEKAVKVYWNSKDRLPPRAIKIDINIERDLAYALNVKQGPQILFLAGNRIIYREKEFRTSDEIVQMIAHFYYKAKLPSWVDKSAISRY